MTPTSAEDKPALQAVQAEAEGVNTVTVEYGGRSYVLPASLDDADASVLEAIDDRKASYAIRELLGPEQYKAFKATKPKVRDYDGLFTVYAEMIGLESAGE